MYLKRFNKLNIIGDKVVEKAGATNILLKYFKIIKES